MVDLIPIFCYTYFYDMLVLLIFPYMISYFGIGSVQDSYEEQEF